ncbi:hypothetical protein BASA62_001499 [Batrachochytrium salamandrivorans]|nr:hypothetical protein BASA62_001499 [Batrachochytrium salamandrivorans]
MDVDNSLHKIEQKWQELSYRAENRVAFQDFKINDLALFLPARNQIAWSAFNVDTPNYFLDHQSSTMFVEKTQRRGWILAYITGIVSKSAKNNNPFGLAEGTDFHICTVE